MYGGGAAEMWMAKCVEDAARTESDASVVAMESFATALRALPTIISDNGGYDSTALVAGLKGMRGLFCSRDMCSYAVRS